MSTATATLSPPVAGLGADRRPSLARLVAVELRKMVDTRAGFWLQLGTLGLMITLVVVTVVLGETEDTKFEGMLWSALWPASILLPVVGILLVSSEWSQRTSMITFTLVPRRSRVVAAKLGAALVVSMIALTTSLAIAAVGTAIAAPDVDDRWSLPPEMLGQAAIYISSAMTMGLGFGAMLLSSAPAIVLYFALPLGWTLLGSISVFESSARWLDNSQTLAPMSEHALDATEWAQAGATLALWMLLPLLIGLWRIRRDEVQ
jgi:ABC-2 type transport system permease protein